MRNRRKIAQCRDSGVIDSGRLHSEAKRLRGLESKNARLKKLLADAMLDNAAPKDLRCYAEDATPTLMGTTPEI